MKCVNSDAMKFNNTLKNCTKIQFIFKNFFIFLFLSSILSFIEIAFISTSHAEEVVSYYSNSRYNNYDDEDRDNDSNYSSRRSSRQNSRYYNNNSNDNDDDNYNNNYTTSSNTYSNNISNSSLYQIEIPMNPNLGQNGQTIMIQKALEDLFVKLSGTEKILEKPIIKNTITQADRFSKKISYHQPSPGLRTIRVEFKEGPIRNIILQAGGKIWEQKRPLTLAVLVVEDGKNIKWVGQDHETKPMQEIQTLANKRGLLIVFPMLDLTDTGQLSELDVKQNNFEKIQSIASRYSPDVIWTGKIREEDKQFIGKFTTVNQGKNIQFEAKGENLNAMLNNALEQLTQTLRGVNPTALHSELAVPVPSKEIKPILLTVTGNLNGERYVRVMNYLLGLPSVVDVIVEQISSDKTVFSIETHYTKEEMASLISKDPILIENSSSYPNTERNLIYKLSEAL